MYFKGLTFICLEDAPKNHLMVIGGHLLKHYVLCIINRAAMGRARFMVYPWFIIFLFFVGDQTQTFARPNFESRNVRCLFAKSCWNINTRTVLRILFSLLWVEYIFFWFYQSVGFKGNNKHAKKIITSAMECANVAAFTFPGWQIRSCLLCKVISAEATAIYLFAVLQVFLVVLGK